MDISQDSQTFTQILRDITELEPALFYVFTAEIHPRTGAIGSLHGFCEGYAYETIVPYSQDVFTHKPQTETLNGLSTPLTQDRWTPPIKHQRTIRAQIHRSASPEQYYWEGIHETALQGQGSQATDQADAIIRVAQRHVPEFSELLQNSPLQKSRDSSPAYKDIQEATHLDPEEAPKTPVTRTAKPDDFKVLNDISEVDDLMFCEVANLIEAANSGGATASCEIDQAVLFKAFTQGLKSRKALLQRRMGILFEHQYNQDVSFWRRELPRMLNNSRVKTSKYLR
ncbi:uncharacterized protein LOC129861495 [Salvelinus fontinalis]|uniref:uncharacterized protein LOC129843381 n=1 Tax=Salvelinus fontinalis TaxID=8038 RepID=UPI0024855264|nr:uncharacterized protein LOC129843381 [Salvelinus fontinalis]XP_055788851.1 uncharacterized protein LOC129861495 [Salvelinus fontinalis]